MKMIHECEKSTRFIYYGDGKWWIREKDGGYLEVKYCPFCGIEFSHKVTEDTP
jgi:hypothetical protein